MLDKYIDDLKKGDNEALEDIYNETRKMEVGEEESIFWKSIIWLMASSYQLLNILKILICI